MKIPRRGQNFTVRLRPPERELLDRAAELSLLRTTEFIRAHALRAAEKLVREKERGQ